MNRGWRPSIFNKVISLHLSMNWLTCQILSPLDRCGAIIIYTNHCQFRPATLCIKLHVKQITNPNNERRTNVATNQQLIVMQRKDAIRSHVLLFSHSNKRGHTNTHIYIHAHSCIPLFDNDRHILFCVLIFMLYRWCYAQRVPYSSMPFPSKRFVSSIGSIDIVFCMDNIKNELYKKM